MLFVCYFDNLFQNFIILNLKVKLRCLKISISLFSEAIQSYNNMMDWDFFFQIINKEK